MQMCVLIFVGTNGETYYNTVALVSCVQNFPKSRGPVVGILKGFAGLGGAILTQIYAMIHSPNHASLIFMVVVGPAMIFMCEPQKQELDRLQQDSSECIFDAECIYICIVKSQNVYFMYNLMGILSSSLWIEGRIFSQVAWYLLSEFGFVHGCKAQVKVDSRTSSKIC
jgi:hypothetical protein